MMEVFLVVQLLHLCYLSICRYICLPTFRTSILTMRLCYRALLSAWMLTVTQGWSPPSHWKFTGIRNQQQPTTKLDDASSVMQENNMSPCVIKVIGVGGGG